MSRVPSNVLTLPDFKKALQTGGTDRQTDRLTEHSFMTIDCERCCSYFYKYWNIQYSYANVCIKLVTSDRHVGTSD